MGFDQWKHSFTKANADLAAARAEAHEECTEEAAMLALKRLEEANMDVDLAFANVLWNFVLSFIKKCSFTRKVYFVTAVDN